MRRIRSRSLASLTAALLALAFATPLRRVWATAEAPWWLVYLLWACAIFALWLLDRGQRRAGPAGELEAGDRE